MAAVREFPKDSRIGYVDLERVAALSSEGKAATAQLAALRTKKAAEVAERSKQVELLWRAFTTRLFPVVGQVATEKNLWAVLSSETTLVWHLPAIDLSEEIAKRLDAAPPQK